MASPIQEFYSNQTIFLTGATGFVGKLTLEKLLRICYDVRKIYILIRKKKGKTEEERLNELFDNACFDIVKSLLPDYREKVQMVCGDCEEPAMGISGKDLILLKNEVTCIIHAAANVKFDCHIKTALFTNLRAVRDLVEFARLVDNLISFVYVSTAFSHCYKNFIEEKFYEVPLEPEQVLTLAENLDDRVLSTIKPHMLNKWPNSYVFSKAMAECLINRECQDLPVAVVRPAIVISTADEPLPGWIDNISGIAGLTIGISLGVIRSLNLDREATASLIPADYVVNNILAAGWDVAHRPKATKAMVDDPEEDSNIPIYNLAGCDTNLKTWGQYVDEMMGFCHKYPLSSVIWYYCFKTTKSNILHKLRVFFLHVLYAFFVDLLLKVFNKKPIAVKKYRRINKLINCLTYFSTRSWRFSSGNVDQLWKKLSKRDKTLFNFNMERFDWSNYFESLVIGGRIYLMKDPLDTVPRARRKIYVLAVAHYALLILFYWILYKILRIAFGFVFPASIL